MSLEPSSEICANTAEYFGFSGKPAGRPVVWSALLVAVACLAWFVLQGAELLIWMID